MNFFYRLPLLKFTLFLLSSAQSSGDYTCDLRKICHDRQNAEFPLFLQKEIGDFNMPWYSIFVDTFTKQTTLLPNIDYISCLVNTCDDHIKVVTFLFKKSLKEEQQRRRQMILFDVFELMNIVMTKKQRERFENSLKKMNPHYQKIQKSVGKMLSGNSAILKGWENGFGIVDKSTFDNQNENLEVIVRTILRRQMAYYHNIPRNDDSSFMVKLRSKCPSSRRGPLSRATRDYTSDYILTETEKQLQNYFQVDLKNCEARSESCTLGNRVKVLIAKYMFETSEQFSRLFYNMVC